MPQRGTCQACQVPNVRVASATNDCSCQVCEKCVLVFLDDACCGICGTPFEADEVMLEEDETPGRG